MLIEVVCCCSCYAYQAVYIPIADNNSLTSNLEQQIIPRFHTKVVSHVLTQCGIRILWSVYLLVGFTSV